MLHLNKRVGVAYSYVIKFLLKKCATKILIDVFECFWTLTFTLSILECVPFGWYTLDIQLSCFRKMKILFYWIPMLAYVFATEISDDLIQVINTKQNLWTAGRNFPKNFPVQKLLGIKRKRGLQDIPILRHDINESDELPKVFDARLNWPGCKSIREVPDQSACGSGWVNKICFH